MDPFLLSKTYPMAFSMKFFKANNNAASTSRASRDQCRQTYKLPRSIWDAKNLFLSLSLSAALKVCKSDLVQAQVLEKADNVLAEILTRMQIIRGPSIRERHDKIVAKHKGGKKRLSTSTDTATDEGALSVHVEALKLCDGK